MLQSAIARLEACKLAHELASDRAARAGDQHRLAGDLLRDRGFARFEFSAAQKVRSGQLVDVRLGRPSEKVPPIVTDPHQFDVEIAGASGNRGDIARAEVHPVVANDNAFGAPASLFEADRRRRQVLGEAKDGHAADLRDRAVGLGQEDADHGNGRGLVGLCDLDDRFRPVGAPDQKHVFALQRFCTARNCGHAENRDMAQRASRQAHDLHDEEGKAVVQDAEQHDVGPAARTANRHPDGGPRDAKRNRDIDAHDDTIAERSESPAATIESAEIEQRNRQRACCDDQQRQVSDPFGHREARLEKRQQQHKRAGDRGKVEQHHAR